MTSPIIELTDETFDETVASSSHLLIDFSAEWCHPCHALDAVLSELADEGVGPFGFAKVDVAAHPGLAERFGIASLPTMFIMRDGELVRKLFGAKSRRQIEETLQRYIES